MCPRGAIGKPSKSEVRLSVQARTHASRITTVRFKVTDAVAACHIIALCPDCKDHALNADVPRAREGNVSGRGEFGFESPFARNGGQAQTIRIVGEDEADPQAGDAVEMPSPAAELHPASGVTGAPAARGRAPAPQDAWPNMSKRRRKETIAAPAEAAAR